MTERSSTAQFILVSEFEMRRDCFATVEFFGEFFCPMLASCFGLPFSAYECLWSSLVRPWPPGIEPVYAHAAGSSPSPVRGPSCPRESAPTLAPSVVREMSLDVCFVRQDMRGLGSCSGLYKCQTPLTWRNSSGAVRCQIRLVQD